MAENRLCSKDCIYFVCYRWLGEEKCSNYNAFESIESFKERMNKNGS